MTPAGTATGATEARTRATFATGMKIGYRDRSDAGSQGRVDDDLNKVFDFGRNDLGI